MMSSVVVILDFYLFYFYFILFFFFFGGGGEWRFYDANKCDFYSNTNDFSVINYTTNHTNYVPLTV